MLAPTQAASGVGTNNTSPNHLLVVATLEAVHHRLSFLNGETRLILLLFKFNRSCRFDKTREIIFIFFLLFAVIPNAVLGQEKLAPVSDQQEYLELARKIFTWSDDEKSKLRKHTGESQENETVQQMRRIIQRRVIGAIKQGGREAGIVNSLLPVQSVSLATDAYLTNTPYAKCFSLNSAPYCLAAYTILRGSDAVADSQCYIDLFSGQTDSEIASFGASDFRGHKFFVKEVPSKVAGQEWILAWGSVLGDTGARLTVRLYSFDGKKRETIWSRDELTAGQLQVFDGFIRLDYDPYYHSHVSERKTETLYFTPNGLQ